MGQAASGGGAMRPGAPTMRCMKFIANTRRAALFLIAFGIPMALVTACGGGGGAPGAPEDTGTAHAPAKVYALMDPGESPSSIAQFAALTTVDGLAYRARWRDLEPT